MIAFVIKSAICMVLFYGLYWLILRKEKLLSFNRFYLIFSLILSLAIPFISVPVIVGYEKASAVTSIFSPDKFPDEGNRENAKSMTEESMQESVSSDQIIHSEVAKTRLVNVNEVLIIIYIFGLLIMMIRFYRNIMKVKLLLKKSEKIDQVWYRIALLDDKMSPFSFLRTVFLNKADYIEKRVGINVLNHELEHIKQGHSLDVIFFEILHSLLWFNPSMLLYKRAARINHEYLADEAVVNGITDTNTYADELITFVRHHFSVPYASGFSPSMIRLRLFMLNRPAPGKSTKSFKISITLILLVTLGLLICLRPTYSQASMLPQSDSKKVSIKNIGNQDIIIDEVYFRDPGFKPLRSLLVLDGKKLGPDDMFSVNTGDIKTIKVLKNRNSTRKYGKSGKDGVVEITTYANDNKSVPDSMYFKPLYTINDTTPEQIRLAVSNINSLRTWTYPVFQNQDPVKQWRLIEIMTRDYYTVKGKVSQKNGEPLKGITVRATENPVEAVTDENGYFVLNDVNSGSLVTLSAETLKPLTFKVTDKIFKSNPEIILQRVDEPDTDMIIAGVGRDIADFSGSWTFNKDNSRTYLPEGYSMNYEIHQFGSDSLVLIASGIRSGVERRNYTTFVFNTAKRNIYLDGNRSYVEKCTIAPDGRSFSIVRKSSSLVIIPGAFNSEYTSSETFSLSPDGNQLIVREYRFNDASADKGEELQMRIFDKE